MPKKPRLTSQQWEAMKTAAEGGKMYGYLLGRTVPSLIKHGLIVRVRVKVTAHPLMGASTGIGGMRYIYQEAYMRGNLNPRAMASRTREEDRYYLTSKGLEMWEARLHKRYESERAEADSKYERALAAARGRVREEPSAEESDAI